jgi:hypothetical protein
MDNYIPTRKKRTKYHFITRREPSNEQLNDIDQFTFFYQICTFPNPNTNKFHLRKFVINNRNEFVNTQEFYLSKRQCKRFYEMKNSHEYRNYPMYSLDDVPYPKASDITLSKSSLHCLLER